MASRRRRNYGRDDLHYSRDEVQAYIVPLAVEGVSAREICERVRERLGIELTRDDVKYEVRRSWKQRRLTYEPQRAIELAQGLQDFVKGRGLRGISAEVVATVDLAHVAEAGAERLCRLIAQAHRDDPALDELHIGFAGGRSACLMAMALADRLADRERWASLGRRPRLVFHSLIGPMNPSSPQSDPNAFLIYLAARNGPELPFDLRFNSLPAPGVVTREEYRRIKGPNGGGFGLVRAAMRERDRLDMIVFSCGHWGAGHQSVHDYLERACLPDDELRAGWEAMSRHLRDLGVVGDVMWTPIHPERASLHLPRHVRLLGLFEDIFDLVRFANPDGEGVSPSRAARRAALLLAGPCSGPGCHRSKGEILATLLRRMSRLPMTHLITDSRSAREALTALGHEWEKAPPRPPGKRGAGRGRGRPAPSEDG